MNKKIIKKMFDREFNASTMRAKILEREEKYRFGFLTYAVSVCLIIIVGSILVASHSHVKFQETLPVQHSVTALTPNRSINVNKLDKVISNEEYDEELKTITKDLYVSIMDKLKDINIPSDLGEFSSYALYSGNGKDENGEFDTLIGYVYNYMNGITNKSVRMTFSNTNKPVKDYIFEDTLKISKIRDTEVIIYQYEDSYDVEFFYDDYNFDIETNEVSIEELTSILESVIK